MSAPDDGGQERYRVEGEVARGGMGVVLRVWDRKLRRRLAMKVIRDDVADEAASDRHSRARTSRRFLEEAQITGQLDHPGIVPVHDLGRDGEDRSYYTMKLVRGRDLREIFRLVHAGEEGWTEVRALRVLLRICESMAYAHEKGVIHRDLKPANVMVGRFGAVYVMDWGLARVLETDDSRVATPGEREGAGEGEADEQLMPRATNAEPDPLSTLEGEVIGTPAYMSPEQAAGEHALLGRRTDVYSVGAMLYHLLAGFSPYGGPDGTPPHAEVLTRVRAGGPVPLVEAAREAAPELVAICEKAMERGLDRRYQRMEDLARDLEAYLEGRVVRAYEGGAVAELRKWVGRNRPLAAAIGGAFALLAIGLATSTAFYVTAESRLTEITRLSAHQRHADLVVRADELWPIGPAQRDAFEAWLADAEELLAERPVHEAEFAALARGLGLEPGESVELAEATNLERWEYSERVELRARLEELADPERGLLRGALPSPEHGWSVERRLELLREVDRRTKSGPSAERLWEQAIDAVADVERSPRYRGLVLEETWGFLPLGPDPRTGLWEFAHLLSGEVPGRDPRSKELVITEHTGLVFVLLPGGRFSMGHEEPPADPVHFVDLDPFLVSKYEMTQAQWERVHGANPSFYYAGRELDGVTFTGLHPVEWITWEESDRAMRRLGLRLPSEAQWEYACYAGAPEPKGSWYTGDEPASLAGHANVLDAGSEPPPSAGAPEPGFSDGHLYHAPVGSYAPNAFGLHDVHGNVWEPCSDWRGSYELAVREGDGERLVDLAGESSPKKAQRGGGFNQNSQYAKGYRRSRRPVNHKEFDNGLRPAASIRFRE